MTDEKAYETPQALRQAVTARLRAVATPHGRWTLAELQRQFAYDRLLARLYVIDNSWILKGAVALLSAASLGSSLGRHRPLSECGAHDGRA